MVALDMRAVRFPAAVPIPHRSAPGLSGFGAILRRKRQLVASLHGSEHFRENAVAKGQKRSNKEVKKPKQKKDAPAAAASFQKGLSAPAGVPKKKP
jgi:hypothetical protein